MSSWFHTVKGQYHITDKFIGLDFARLFLHPEEAQGTFIHEITHGIIAEFDFGQATQNFLWLQNSFAHLSESEQAEMAEMLVMAQNFVQEGFATLMQVQRLGSLMGKKAAREWAEKNLPPDYLSRLHEFDFLLGVSQKQKDFFTSKASEIAMQTGIRKNAPTQGVFRNPAALKDYLKGDNNPDFRLRKMIEILKYKPYLVTRPQQEIAEACGITFYPYATKQECADFLNYVLDLSGKPERATAAMVGDTPLGVDLVLKVADKTVVSNINLNLAETAELILNTADLLHYADVLEAIILIDNNASEENKDFFRRIIKDEPEINVIGFRQTGEKYTSMLSKAKAVEIFNNHISKPTLLVKEGYYNPSTKNMDLASGLRTADVVIFNNADNLRYSIAALVKQNKDLKLKYLHAGTTENHPFQMLIVKVDGQSPIFVASAFGNKKISDFIQELKDNLTIMSAEEIRENKRHLNNFMSTWLGVPWQADWIETMLDGQQFHFR